MCWIYRNKMKQNEPIIDRNGVEICARKVMSIYISLDIIKLVNTSDRFTLATIDRDRLVSGEKIDIIIYDRLKECGVF